MSTVGVLLPVRIETRFVAPADGGSWALRVRVVPDAVSVSMHDPVPSAVELDAVTRLWQGAGGADLSTPEGRRAWLGLVATVGGERAAWLARTFPPVSAPDGTITVDRPAEQRDDMRRSHLMGLPPSIELWLARGGQAPVRAAVLTVLVDEIDLDFADPEGTQQAWWSSFPEAVRVGLAVELDVGLDRPDDIDVLFVVGIGGGDPGPLLAAHADASRLGIMTPGLATTSIDGRPAASLGDDPDEQLVVLRTDVTTQPGTVALASAMVGAGGSGVTAVSPVGGVPALPGGDSDHGPLNRALVGTLWPALWGHSLADVQGSADLVDLLGLWAADNVVPEGPLPSLRVGTTPYGLLPATSLERWRPAAGDPVVERNLVPLVRDLVARWAAVAEQLARGHRPFDLKLRTPNAGAYQWRWLVPLDVAHAVAFRFGDTARGQEVAQWWDRRAASAPQLGSLVATPSVAPGAPAPPDAPAASLPPPTAAAVPGPVRPPPPVRRVPPVRPGPRPLPDPVASPPAPLTRLVSVGWGQPLSLPLVAPEGPPDGPPAVGAPVAEVHAELQALRTASLAGVLAAPATTLLGELSRCSLAASSAAVARAAASQPRALVEPMSADAGTPTQLDTWALRFQPSDLDHAPGAVADVHRNVLAGLEVLAELPAADLDRGLRAALDTATHRIDPWAVGIAWRRLQALATSPRSLGVYGWVDGPRPASPPAHEYVLAPSIDQATVAAVLRDRAIRDPDADRWQMDLTSDRIRGALRVVDEVRGGSHPAEALGRAVEAAVGDPLLVDELRATFPMLAQLASDRLKLRRVCNGVDVLAAAADDPARLAQLGLSAEMLDALRLLAADVDAAGDLQVADAVLGLVRGQPAQVAGATTAAAGLGIPGPLDVVRTPRTGRSVTTIVTVVLPERQVPPDAAANPMMLADPAVASFLDDRAGDPAGLEWTWTVVGADGQPAGSVTLADAALRPSDTVGLGAENLAQAVRDITGRGTLAAGAVAGHARLRAMATALTGVPARPEDVADPTAPADGDASDAELRARLTALRAAAVAALTGLQAAASPAATADDRRAALRTAARWGITPLAAAGADEAAAVEELAVRVGRAADVLARRIDATATTSAIADLTFAETAEQLAVLAAPQGACPIFARLDGALCGGLVADAADDGTGASLDPDWLETVAPVRRAVARLEAVQLDERLRSDGQPLAAWTSRPGDPWQTVAEVAANELPIPTRLVAAFGPPATLPAEGAATVAVAVVDTFVEAVPDTQQLAAVAFDHELPPARAPQAILLAVPPDVDAPLDTDALVDIVSEARLLAHARVVDPDRLGPAVNALHLAALSVGGQAGVRLGGA